MMEGVLVKLNPGLVWQKAAFNPSQPTDAM
jgi:hypothetical protein